MSLILIICAGIAALGLAALAIVAGTQRIGAAPYSVGSYMLPLGGMILVQALLTFAVWFTAYDLYFHRIPPPTDIEMNEAIQYDKARLFWVLIPGLVVIWLPLLLSFLTGPFRKYFYPKFVFSEGLQRQLRMLTISAWITLLLSGMVYAIEQGEDPGSHGPAFEASVALGIAALTVAWCLIILYYLRPQRN